MLTTGCASYHAKPISPEGKNLEFESRTLDDPALKDFIQGQAGKVSPWPPESWDFSLLSLAARYYHPELDQARARVKSAEAAVMSAGARPNPSISFAPEFSANPPAGDSPWIVGAALDVPIETAGKRGYRLNRAKYLAQAASLDVAAGGCRIRTMLRKALLELSAAKMNCELLEKQLSLMEELVLLYRQRLAAGEISESEVNAAKISLDQSRLQLQGMLRRERAARGMIASSVGLPARALEKIAISTRSLEQVPALATLSSGELRRSALLTRPDVLAALAEYDAAESSLRLEFAKQYPDLTLGPGYQWDQGQHKWIFGFSVALPVFNRNEGPIAEAEAHRGEAEARLAALQAAIIGDIDRAAANFDASFEKSGLAQGVMAGQKRQLDFMVALFDAGEADRLALVNAQADYLAAELSGLNAVTELQDALGRLESALQCTAATGTASTLHPSEAHGKAGEER